ncbi:hypothetical protein BSLG_005865 [Batrachochytrium salamandrivorans]|nr:hypothetical protein BSLG_005865 [Batrachochytrium salamandrivorans]
MSTAKPLSNTTILQCKKSNSKSVKKSLINRTRRLRLDSCAGSAKDDKLEQTFKQVAQNFSDIWEKIVPSGQGHLIMLRRSDEATQDDSLQPGRRDTLRDSAIEQYTGVAINRSDPAPFYLFDEIDAALDAQYRTAIADMVVYELSEHAQFITTTFRPELLEHTDKCHGVTFVDKVSRIQCISKDGSTTVC